MERKSVDTENVSLTSALTTWQIFLLNGMTQGTSATQHIGRRATMTSVLARFKAFVGDYCRVCIIYDKETNGAAPAATDIFASNQATSPLNLNNSDRFIVIADETPMLKQGQVATAATSMAVVEMYRKMALPILFNAGSAGTVADINSGAIYFCFNNDGGTISDPMSNFRVRFTDA